MIDLDPITTWIRTARWVITSVILAALLGGIGVQTWRLKSAQTDLAKEVATFAKYRADQETQHAADEKHARTTEQELYAALDVNRKQAHDKQAALDARVADLLRQLHNRPDRPTPGGAVAPAAGNPPACTGAGLYRQDSEFLAGEAAAAAAIAVERDKLWRDYDDARRKLAEGQPK
jgi:hypothetical protein